MLSAVPCPRRLPGSSPGTLPPVTNLALLLNKRVPSASRGIGLELTKQLLVNPDVTVVATCRDPERATDLHALRAAARGTLHVARLDVADEGSIRASVQAVQALLGEDGALDYIYNNAAIVRSPVPACSWSRGKLPAGR